MPYRGHIFSIDWVTFEPHPLDPDLVFALHEDGWIRTVNLRTGALENVLKTTHARRPLDRVGISPDARAVAVTGLRNNRLQVDILDLHTGQRKAGVELPYSPYAPYLKFSTSGDTLVAATPERGQIYVLDVATNTLRRSWQGKAPGLTYLSNKNKTVTFWPIFGEPDECDIVTGTVTSRPAKGGYKTGNGNREHHAFTPDNTRVFDLSYGSLRQFDIGSGRKLFDERLPAGSARFSRLSLFANEGLLATLSAVSDGAAVLLVHDSLDGHVLQRRLIAMKKTVALDWTLVTHPLSKRIAVACGNTLKVWSIPDPMETLRVNAHALSVQDSGFWFSRNPNVAHFVASAKQFPPNKTQAQLARINLENLEKSQGDKPEDTSLLVLNKDTPPVIHLSANRDGSLVGMQFSQSPTLVIWRNQDDSLVEINRFDLPGYSGFTQVSPTGRLVWSSTGSIETASGKQLQRVNRKNLSEHPEWISPAWVGESYVAEVLLLRKEYSRNTIALERSIVLWSAKTDDPVAIAPAPEVNALAASPDGAQIVEAGKDMRVRIRNGTTLAVERTIRVHDGPVIGVAWHPTLPLLATAAEDFSVRIWDLRTDTLVEEFRTTRNTPTQRLRWSPDGRFLGVSYKA